MRAITQIVVLSNPSTELDRLLCVDEDGFLWTTVVLIGEPVPKEIEWIPIPGPGDNPPFMDMRDQLTRLEDSLKATAEDNKRLKERLDGLPPIGDDETTS